MERLTKENPTWLNEEFWFSAEEPDDELIDRVYLKLIEYENTGLTPEEVDELQSKLSAKEAVNKALSATLDLVAIDKDCAVRELNDIRRFLKKQTPKKSIENHKNKKLKGIIAFTKEAHRVCKDKEPGKVCDFTCPLCGSEAWAGKSVFNGHCRGECKKCGFKLIE